MAEATAGPASEAKLLITSSHGDLRVAEALQTGNVQGRLSGQRLICATALRRGASEICISPVKGLSSSRIR